MFDQPRKSSKCNSRHGKTRADIKEIQVKNFELNNKIGDLKGKMSTLRMLVELTSQISHLQDEFSNNRLQLESLQMTLKSIEGENEEWKNSIIENKDKISSIDMKLQHLRGESSRCRGERYRNWLDSNPDAITMNQQRVSHRDVIDELLAEKSANGLLHEQLVSYVVHVECDDLETMLKQKNDELMASNKISTIEEIMKKSSRRSILLGLNILRDKHDAR